MITTLYLLYWHVGKELLLERGHNSDINLTSKEDQSVSQGISLNNLEIILLEKIYVDEQRWYLGCDSESRLREVSIKTCGTDSPLQINLGLLSVLESDYATVAFMRSLLVAVVKSNVDRNRSSVFSVVNSDREVKRVWRLRVAVELIGNGPVILKIID